MRNSTFIYLLISLSLDIITIILVRVIRKSDLMKESLYIFTIILESLIVLYIIYRLCIPFNRILVISLIFKGVASIWNIMNIFVVIWLFPSSKEEKILHHSLRVCLLYLLIECLKLYIRVISIFKVNYVNQNNNNNNQTNCWIEIPNEDEKENLRLKNETHNEIKQLNEENIFLKKENKRLKEVYVKIRNNSIRKKKTEIICEYIKSKYNVEISNDILINKLFWEIRNKCNGLIINKGKYEEIIVTYIKQRIFNYLLCPITCQFYSNPYITPDGQTFDKSAILKKIQKTGVNPITNNVLKSQELLENKLVLDICEVIKLNNDFSLKLFKEIKQLLISKSTQKLYENPYVVSEGNNKGNTKERNNGEHLGKYPNLVIRNMIQQNLEIFDDNFLKFDFVIEPEPNNIISTKKTSIVYYPSKSEVYTPKINKPNKELPTQ